MCEQQGQALLFCTRCHWCARSALLTPRATQHQAAGLPHHHIFGFPPLEMMTWDTTVSQGLHRTPRPSGKGKSSSSGGKYRVPLGASDLPALPRALQHTKQEAPAYGFCVRSPRSLNCWPARHCQGYSTDPVQSPALTAAAASPARGCPQTWG